MVSIERVDEVEEVARVRYTVADHLLPGDVSASLEGEDVLVVWDSIEGYRVIRVPLEAAATVAALLQHISEDLS